MPSKEKSIVVNADTFESEVLESRTPVVVDFWADWCGPCHMIEPVLEELAADYAGKATVARVNVDDNPALAEKYMIRSIPALVFFQDGKEVDRVIGAVQKGNLSDKLDGLLASGKAAP